MADRRSPSISSRKQPQQARSAELVATILEAAVQVLAKEGAQRFTTARVAEKAGVSIGSLYQYFPNKASILFRLQSDEWRQTGELLRGIIRSECEEAAMRVALNDAVPLYRDAPEAREAKKSGSRTVQLFMHEVLPAVSDAARASAGDLIKQTLSAVGKHFSETHRSPAEIKTYADAMADMFCAYLRALQNGETQP